MAVLDSTMRPKPRFVDKEWLRQQYANLGAEYNAPVEPGLTAEILQARIADRLRTMNVDPDAIVYVQNRDERESD